MGCGASTGRTFRGPELDQYMAPYLGKWAVKCESSSSSNLCKDGYRDICEISTDMLAPPKLPPWHNAFIMFEKDGCTEVKHGYLQSSGTDPTGWERKGVGVARQAKKRLTINQAEGGDMFWDSLGSHCSIPIDEANPDTFTLQLKIGPGESKYAYEFQRIK